MSDDFQTAPTLFLLMAQYNGKTVVPIDEVCRDFFGHLTVDKLLRKALRAHRDKPKSSTGRSFGGFGGLHR
jgi:Pyocin activator protein PrtN